MGRKPTPATISYLTTTSAVLIDTGNLRTTTCLWLLGLFDPALPWRHR